MSKLTQAMNVFLLFILKKDYHTQKKHSTMKRSINGYNHDKKRMEDEKRTASKKFIGFKCGENLDQFLSPQPAYDWD